jgi:N6-L-threonylcarbamoyladenine synthase
MLDDGADFSFSGLKTAVVTYCRRYPEFDVADVAASFQAAVVDVLVTKLVRAARGVGVDTVVIGGGVAANSELRTRVTEEAGRAGLRSVIPSIGLCTDNAAMIAACAFYRLAADGPTALDSGVTPGLRLK